MNQKSFSYVLQTERKSSLLIIDKPLEIIKNVFFFSLFLSFLCFIRKYATHLKHFFAFFFFFFFKGNLNFIDKFPLQTKKKCFKIFHCKSPSIIYSFEDFTRAANTAQRFSYNFEQKCYIQMFSTTTSTYTYPAVANHQ